MKESKPEKSKDSVRKLVNDHSGARDKIIVNRRVDDKKLVINSATPRAGMPHYQRLINESGAVPTAGKSHYQTFINSQRNGFKKEENARKKGQSK